MLQAVSQGQGPWTAAAVAAMVAGPGQMQVVEGLAGAGAALGEVAGSGMMSLGVGPAGAGAPGLKVYGCGNLCDRLPLQACDAWHSSRG